VRFSLGAWTDGLFDLYFRIEQLPSKADDAFAVPYILLECAPGILRRIRDGA